MSTSTSMTPMRKRASRPGRTTPASPTRSLVWAGLLLLATCSEADQAPGRALSPALKGLGTPPASEAATWRESVSTTAPKGRFLQAAAFDETRSLVVVFGGETRSLDGSAAEATQDTWEWSPATATWKLRSTSGPAPDARGGAAMVFDPVRNKMLLFGGRSATGYDYEDLWEWDPGTGAWTDRSTAGAHPSARAQHGMLYQRSTGKILLFGGGRSDANSSDGTSVSSSLGDTWLLDPATATWTALTPSTSPSVRHDFGLVWDATRNKAVLFGGMQVDIPGATGVPKQDTWDWDPTAGTWTERTQAGSKPGQRYGHAMGFDPGSGKSFLFGGWDMVSAASRNDLWSWDPTTGAWAQLLTGSESGVPPARTWASMVLDVTHGRLELVAGQVIESGGTTRPSGLVGSNDVWELDPATVAFSNRSVDYQGPPARAYHAMAYDPATGKTYMFGGIDPTWKQGTLADLWEWDGSTWTQVSTSQNPGARMDAAMAYDPARQSLILFGGNSWTTGLASADTWEWSGSTRQWSQLSTNGHPDARWGHAMVTDSARKKILLVGGSNGVDGEVWEWDGATLAWSNRTPTGSASVPVGRTYPVASYDEQRQKLVLYDGTRSPSVDGESNSAFWEWDVLTGGWALRDPGDTLPAATNLFAVYDTQRRRHVFLTDAATAGVDQTWELDATSATWYTRALANTPGNRFRAAMAFDGGARVAVMFGGVLNGAPGGTGDDTWVYSVSNLANGEGCSTASASACASGNCVDGVCCESASCTGACKSCNVPGSEGTCVLAQAGSEVAGSCSDGQACDGTGACKSKNGQACSAASACASGQCVDGVCCDGACAGTCMACNLPGRLGTCTAYAAGTDPNGECGQGTGACKSTCDGVGACTFPLGGVSCGSCLTCDGAGTCTRADPTCGVPGKGGAGGKPGTVGSGGQIGMAGSTGTGASPGTGGSAGSSATGQGAAPGGGSGTSGSGGINGGSGGSGSGGSTTNLNDGSVSASGGSDGALGGSGGSARDAADSKAAGGDLAGAYDGSSGGRDSGPVPADDGGLVVHLSRGGCSCDTGTSDARAVSSPWMLVLVAGLLVRGLRRRRPRA